MDFHFGWVVACIHLIDPMRRLRGLGMQLGLELCRICAIALVILPFIDLYSKLLASEE